MKILRFYIPSLILAVSSILSLYGEEIEKHSLVEQSIVPLRDRISDFEARFALAKILSHHKETQEAALSHYEVLLKIHPFQKLLPIPIIRVPTKTISTPRTLVPLLSQVSDFDARLALARLYSHHKKTYGAALRLYQRILHEKPEALDVQIEMGRLYISMKKIHEGLTLFYSALAKHPHSLKLLVAAAQAEGAAGHAEQANALFLRALSVSGHSLQTCIAYADGMMMWGDFYQAQMIYRAALEKNLCSRDLFLKLAWSLASAERYEEAEGIYRELLLRWPDHPKVLEAFAGLKILEKEFDSAYALVEVLLEIAPAKPKYLLLKADILFMNEQFCEAVAAYSLQFRSRKHQTHAYVGIGRSLQKLGRCTEAHDFFQAALNSYPQDRSAQFYAERERPRLLEQILCAYSIPSDLEKWAALYVQNGMPKEALLIYEAILEKDPGYFPAQIGAAEMLAVLYAYEESIEMYRCLLERFPQNLKIEVALARVLGWSKNYQNSIQTYDALIKVDPYNPVLYREKARTALWDKQFDLAMASYQHLLEPSVNSLLLENYPYSLYRIQQSIALEKCAKALVWNKRFRTSLGAYRNLLAFNPGNEEALFDYAQSYCIVGLCDCSKEVYDHILHIDPNHNLVNKALDRNALRSHFGLQGNIAYWRELGSGTFSQSQIARYRSDAVFEVPLSCRAHARFIQNTYVENPFYNYQFYAAEGQTLEADCVINACLSGFVSATYKNYLRRFRSTFSSRNRLVWNWGDDLMLVLGCNKEDEIYNYFSLKQATQSINSWITASKNLTHYWNIEGTCQYYRYNDHNRQIHYNILTEYQFTEDPHIFKAILQGNYRNAAHQSISILSGLKLIDVIHPYWTPDHYYSGSLTFEYRYDYRYFIFCEAPQRYLDLKITGETDSEDNPSIQAILEWKHEFDRHWGVELKGLIHRSKQWNAEGGWGTFYYRF
ncbi:MAG: hypothetical protein CK425_01415 [Parachlamydia sp.]|nr:MAG: hypothetical protein CK425_01415 [Parachlamydia sp.]